MFPAVFLLNRSFLGGKWKKESKSDQLASILAVFASKKANLVSNGLDLESKSCFSKSKDRKEGCN